MGSTSELDFGMFVWGERYAEKAYHQGELRASPSSSVGRALDF